MLATFSPARLLTTPAPVPPFNVPMLLKVNMLVPSFAVPLNRFVAADPVSVTDVDKFSSVSVFDTVLPRLISVIWAKPPVGFGAPDVVPV